jgi:hypothetical protein
MNRSVIISFVVIAVCIIGTAIWWAQPQTVPAQPDKPKIEKAPALPAPPPIAETPKAAVAPPVPPAPPAAPAAPVEAAPASPEQAPAADDPFGGKPITVATLTGCKEVQKFQNADITIEYAPNGEWKVNGNVRAKWTIEGNKVKIYDDKGEVHYIDIVNNKLVYNGKDVKMTR